MSHIDQHKLLGVLSHHIGKGNGINSRILAQKVTGEISQSAERSIREAIVEMRNKGHHICAHPDHGYFIAANETELNETCEFLHARAMTSLKQIAAMKRVSVPDLRGQLNLLSKESGRVTSPVLKFLVTSALLLLLGISAFRAANAGWYFEGEWGLHPNLSSDQNGAGAYDDRMTLRFSVGHAWHQGNRTVSLGINHMSDSTWDDIGQGLNWIGARVRMETGDKK